MLYDQTFMQWLIWKSKGRYLRYQPISFWILSGKMKKHSCVGWILRRIDATNNNGARAFGCKDNWRVDMRRG